MATPIDIAIKNLETAVDKVLKQCYTALAPDATQEERDATREAIENFLGRTYRKE